MDTFLATSSTSGSLKSDLKASTYVSKLFDFLQTVNASE
jgi:hypothetical protein